MHHIEINKNSPKNLAQSVAQCNIKKLSKFKTTTLNLKFLTNFFLNFN